MSTPKYSKTKSSEVVKNNLIVKRYYSTKNEKEKSNDNLQNWRRKKLRLMQKRTQFKM
jgi:hypothetical protein